MSDTGNPFNPPDGGDGTGGNNRPEVGLRQKWPILSKILDSWTRAGLAKYKKQSSEDASYWQNAANNAIDIADNLDKKAKKAENDGSSQIAADLRAGADWFRTMAGNYQTAADGHTESANDPPQYFYTRTASIPDTIGYLKHRLNSKNMSRELLFDTGLKISDHAAKCSMSALNSLERFHGAKFAADEEWASYHYFSLEQCMEYLETCKVLSQKFESMAQEIFN